MKQFKPGKQSLEMVCSYHTPHRWVELVIHASANRNANHIHICNNMKVKASDIHDVLIAHRERPKRGEVIQLATPGMTKIDRRN
jgi:hypothetical protein